MRRASDGRGLIIPTGGLTAYQRTITLFGSGWDRMADAIVSPDLTGDGVPDVVVTSRSGVGKVRPGTGTGTFARAVRTVKSMKGGRSMTAVGDINGDGRNDLVSLVKGSTFRRRVPGHPEERLRQGQAREQLGSLRQADRCGRHQHRRAPDLLGRDKAGRMWQPAGQGRQGRLQDVRPCATHPG